MCQGESRSGWRRRGGGDGAGEGWALVRQIERRGWFGEGKGGTLPSDRRPGARGGLGIFQHAPLHE